MAKEFSHNHSALLEQNYNNYIKKIELVQQAHIHIEIWWIWIEASLKLGNVYFPLYI